MATIVGSRRDADGNSTSFYDVNTQETLVRLQPAILDEDFVGAGHSSIPAAGAPAAGYPWVKKTQQTGGIPTVAIVANSVGGVVALTLASTSELEEATLYSNDQKNWDVTLGLVWEARVAFSVLPSASQVEMVFGLQSSWINGPDTASYYLRFQAEGSGAVNCQSKDGVNTLSVASGVTLVAGAFHLFRIDATNLSNVLFFIDGVQVNANGSITFAATPPNSVLQPYFSAYKASGSGVGTMQVDMVQIAMNRV